MKATLKNVQQLAQKEAILVFTGQIRRGNAAFSEVKTAIATVLSVGILNAKQLSVTFTNVRLGEDGTPIST